MDCSPPGSSVHGILPARIQEWVAMSSSRGSSQTRNQTHVSHVSCIGRHVLYHRHHLGSLHSTWTYLVITYNGKESEKVCICMYTCMCIYVYKKTYISESLSVQFSSVTELCPTLCDPMNHSMPGLSIHHQLPEFTQTHAHRVSDTIQPSHPLSPTSPPAPNPSQYQGLFQWVNSSHEVAKVCWVSASASVLPMNIQGWFPLGRTGWISLQFKGLSRVFSKTTVQKHQFFGTQLSSQSNSHIHTWPLEKP